MQEGIVEFKKYYLIIFGNISNYFLFQKFLLDFFLPVS